MDAERLQRRESDGLLSDHCGLLGTTAAVASGWEELSIDSSRALLSKDYSCEMANSWNIEIPTPVSVRTRASRLAGINGRGQ